MLIGNFILMIVLGANRISALIALDNIAVHLATKLTLFLLGCDYIPHFLMIKWTVWLVTRKNQFISLTLGGSRTLWQRLLIMISMNHLAYFDSI